MPFNPSDLSAIAPETALVVLAVIVLLTELLATRSAAALQAVTAVGLLIVAAIAALTVGEPGGAFNGMVARDGFTSFLKLVIVGVALLTVMISRDYFNPPLPPPSIEEGERRTPSSRGGKDANPPLLPPTGAGGEGVVRHGEYYALLLLTTVGMMTLAAATDLVTLFIGIETMSVGLYLLAGLKAERPRSTEAALKYLLLGAFASGFLLYGMALLYGATGGKTNFNDIQTAIAAGKVGQAFLPVAGQAGVVGQAFLPVAGQAGVVGQAFLPVAGQAGAVGQAFLPVAGQAGAVGQAFLPVASQAGAVGQASLPVAGQAGAVGQAFLPVAGQAGAVGQAFLPVAGQASMAEQTGMSVLLAGVGLILVGLLFKVAAAPFHFWSPDVYQGAPTPVTAFMSAGPKAAALAAGIRLLGWALPELSAVWGPALWVVAALTMTVGNVVAIAQRDIKRMLAYSSISHAGYLLLALLAAGNGNARDAAASGLLFYLAAYYLMNLGAFTVAILVSRAKPGGDYQIDDYQGLVAQKPLLSLAMALFMVSLTGIPPTAGFFGKLFLFSAAVKAGYVGLVVIAVLNSVVSAFYYLRIVVYMYMKPPGAPLALRINPAAAAVILVCAVGILAIGVAPGGVRRLADRGAAEIATPLPNVAESSAATTILEFAAR